MDDDIINNINKKLEELEKKYELLKQANMEYKIQIKRNEQTIFNLNRRIDVMGKKNQIEFENLKKIIENKENIKEENKQNIKEEDKQNFRKENNEILIKSKTNDINKDFFNQIGANNINKKNEKKVDIKKSENKKNEKKVDIKKTKDKKNEKKDGIKKSENKNNEKNEDTIEFVGKTLYELLENKLIKIFTEKNLDIDIEDMNDLKKICSALLIKKIDLIDKINDFLKKNFNNFQDEPDEKNKTNLGLKKGKVYSYINNFSLLKIETKDYEQFLKQFREKYGITEKDCIDKDLMKLIKKNKKEVDVLIKIFKKLKYIK